ncbi:MAG TPA: hypothetical protein VNC61_15785 [Acidimicrobiales bacterium]|nr:hypothetical protein [Acidimicrobiales bacterium]
MTITTFVPDREITWTILGRLRPQIGYIYGYRLDPSPKALWPRRTTTGRPFIPTGSGVVVAIAGSFIDTGGNQRSKIVVETI